MTESDETYRFGPFKLDAQAGILFLEDEPTMIGQRAVTLLRQLLRRAGAPVSKEALISKAWPGLAIEDSNLTVQVAALRRTLARAGGQVGSKHCRGAAIAMSGRQSLQSGAALQRTSHRLLRCPTNPPSRCSRLP